MAAEPFYPLPKGAPEDKEAKPKGWLYHTFHGGFIVHTVLILPWLLGAFVIIGALYLLYAGSYVAGTAILGWVCAAVIGALCRRYCAAAASAAVAIIVATASSTTMSVPPPP